MGVTPVCELNTPVKRGRLGMLGGAFDPPHRAHRALAEAALAYLALDELRLVPTGQAWHKARGLSEARHRLAMTELAFEGVDRVRVDPLETQRTGPSFTIDTLQALQAQRPNDTLFLVIGGDQARAFPSWHRWQEIAEIAIICVAERDQSTRTQAISGLEGLPKGRWLTLPMPPIPLSATDIRQRVAAREPIDHLVGERVARYIGHHHLYLAA